VVDRFGRDTRGAFRDTREVGTTTSALGTPDIPAEDRVNSEKSIVQSGTDARSCTLASRIVCGAPRFLPKIFEVYARFLRASIEETSQIFATSDHRLSLGVIVGISNTNSYSFCRREQEEVKDILK
jgi:hypothetical protein